MGVKEKKRSLWGREYKALMFEEKDGGVASPRVQGWNAGCESHSLSVCVSGCAERFNEYLQG